MYNDYSAILNIANYHSNSLSNYNWLVGCKKALAVNIYM